MLIGLLTVAEALHDTVEVSQAKERYAHIQLIDFRSLCGQLPIDTQGFLQVLLSLSLKRCVVS